MYKLSMGLFALVMATSLNAGLSMRPTGTTIAGPAGTELQPGEIRQLFILGNAATGIMRLDLCVSLSNRTKAETGGIVTGFIQGKLGQVLVGPLPERSLMTQCMRNATSFGVQCAGGSTQPCKIRYRVDRLLPAPGD